MPPMLPAPSSVTPGARPAASVNASCMSPIGRGQVGRRRRRVVGRVDLSGQLRRRREHVGGVGGQRESGQERRGRGADADVSGDGRGRHRRDRRSSRGSRSSPAVPRFTASRDADAVGRGDPSVVRAGWLRGSAGGRGGPLIVNETSDRTSNTPIIGLNMVATSFHPLSNLRASNKTRFQSAHHRDPRFLNQTDRLLVQFDGSKRDRSRLRNDVRDRCRFPTSHDPRRSGLLQRCANDDGAIFDTAWRSRSRSLDTGSNDRSSPAAAISTTVAKRQKAGRARCRVRAGASGVWRRHWSCGSAGADVSPRSAPARR